MVDFNKTVDRRGTNSVKWDRGVIEELSGNPDAIPFWVADMDLPGEPHIKAKGEEIASLGVYGYPTHFDIPEVAKAWLEAKHSWSVDKSTIIYTMGLLHGIALAIDTFTRPGDKILVPSPTYLPFRELCSRSGRVMEDYPLPYRDGIYSFDRERFKNQAKLCSAILFCSPHNPSGLVFSREDLAFVLETGKELDIPVFSDEIHADLVHDGVRHYPMGLVNSTIGAKCITFMAPSKTFNVAGEHSAIAIFSDKEMQRAIEKKQSALWLTNPGYLIGELTTTAYKDGLEYNKELCTYLTENMRIIREYLKESCPEIIPVNGEASFVTFLDCSSVYERIRKRVLADPERYKVNGIAILSKFFGVEAKVAMNDGTWFGEKYGAFVRFNYGTGREEILAALARMSKAIKALR